MTKMDIKKSLQKKSVIGRSSSKKLSRTLGFPIVGVGASAGGLDAFSRLLQALPDDTGMAFVLVQHLSPTHTSSLAAILSKKTKMPVSEARDSELAQPNHVYVIPPGMDMVISSGLLNLTPRNAEQKQHLPIDQFLCSLAEDKGVQAIGVILSGAATDGTLGLEAIKANGGITFAQDDTAETSSMPHSAIGSGCVDFVLPPDKIAEEIVRISLHPYLSNEKHSVSSDIQMDIAPIIELLNNSMGIDFTHYKPNTLYRRITRRMLLSKIEGIKEYTKLLQDNPKEAENLYQDILINVTSFFRNPEVFEALKVKVFPKIIQNRANNDPVRIWSLGCSTGEETYSLAIAFTEYSESVGLHIPLQLFATDLNSSCIDKARVGIYPKTIEHDVSPERLRRFFTEVDGSYRITKSIRDLCIFSRHNVLTDPPFSRMDLISCRNLLIYMEPVLQQQIMSLFHYAIKPNGTLWLGGSETIGSHRNLFEVEDIKNKFYYKKVNAMTVAQPVSRPSKVKRTDFTFDSVRAYDGSADLHKQADRVLLTKYAPPSVLISSNMEILQFRGDTSPYLMPAQGKASFNLMKMLREGLIVAIRAAVGRAGKEMISVREKGLRIKSDGGYREIDIEVIPIKENFASEGGFLIIFEDISSPSYSLTGLEYKNINEKIVSPVLESEEATKQITRLTQELSDTREYLQSVIDQQEIANEELQTAHEEVQSTNEELQSINEELETSKEEIQASNEELATINDEMNIRNQEMSRINNDIVNLLGGIELTIVMLDAELRIRRFTPWAEKMLNLIPSDIARPFCDIKLNFTWFDIEPLLQEVLHENIVKEVEIQNKEGIWYSLRVRPYKTTDNIIDGVVIMLVNADTLKRAYEYSESIIATVREPLLVLDENMCVKIASRSFLETFELLSEEVVSHVIFDIGDGQWNIPQLRKMLKEILPRDNYFNDFEIEQEFGSIGKRNLMFTARRLIQLDNTSPAILVAIEDVTDRKQLEHVLRQRAEELAVADTYKNEFLATLAHELRTPLTPIGNALEMMRIPNMSRPEILELRELMERQLKQMVRLVDDLMDVSRITSGKIELQIETLKLKDIINSAIETVNPLIVEYNHKLTVEFSDDGILVHADFIRLSQVFSNILSNAVKYTNPGGKIQLVARQKEDKVVITISDNGIGISEDMIPKIFNMFIQVDTSFERMSGGLGIGLSLVKNLITMHNGTVEARSDGLGKGSEFIITLPVVEPSDGVRSSDESEVTKNDNTPSYRVLVVDDNKPCGQTLGWILEMLGHEVRLASDGLEAINIAKSFVPKIILLDIGLPNMNGYEVCKLMKKEPDLHNTVFIAQTGWGQEEHKKRSKEAGFDYHLVKPVNIQMLEDIIGAIDKADLSGENVLPRVFL